MSKIDTLFLDIGGVLMTNGWDHLLRERAANVFDFNFEEFEKLHREFYDSYESGFSTLDDYLNKTIFWKKRDFTLQEFKDFMFNASTPWPDMLKLMHEIKTKFQIRIAFVSNEGRELCLHRIQKAHLKSFGDHFFVSCFVHLQKPNPMIYRLALDVMQVAPDEVFYIDDRPKLVDAAKAVGIQGFVHKNLEETRQKLMEIL